MRNCMGMIRKTLAFLFVCIAFCSCSRMNRLPSSTGQPYEVVLVGDTDSVVTRMLMHDVEGLPQAEPMFNLIRVKKGHDKGMYSLVRTRIVVDVDARNKGYDVQKKMNSQADPQMILWVKAQSAEQLRQKLDGAKLRALLDAFELKYLAGIIRQNVDKQKDVKRLFGLDMKVPLDMEASKKGKDFRWYSNNANTGMQSLLVFKARGVMKARKVVLPKLKDGVDSVLRINMPGEVNGMYMQLSSMIGASMPLRGLWDMKGDAMGGPYVMKVLPMKVPALRGKAEEKDDAIVVMGFVYAPEMKKRNLIKQLEAVLTTIKY